MTNEDPPPGPLRRGLRTGRLEAFSDGVFAIAITLLVLDIAVPASAEKHLLRSVADLWPSYLGYVTSVSTIGAIWLGHTVITEYLELTDVGFVRLNLLLLLVIAFVPFPTKLFAEFIGEESPEHVAATIYGLSLLLASALLLVLWRYAVRHRLVRPDAADEEVQLLTKRLTPALAAYPVLIVTGLFTPAVAVIGYLGIALYDIIPFRGSGSIPFRRNRHLPRP
ncbi:MAG TPA: TMEM175 family protein [Streptosporangiaceae bacterium]|nr:TMEM175 family protein [Streptosporangiaceae bacterium]